MSDHREVGCEQFREALSARLDGEDDPGERAVVNAHLAGCAACRRWLNDAAGVNRLVRTGPAVVGPDLTAAVLAAAPGPGRARLAVVLRVVLGGLGAAQVFLGLVQVAALGSAGGHVHVGIVGGASANHLWHESAAWNVALGAGFLWLAIRRDRPGGVVAILTVFVGVLGLLSAGDVVAGRVAALRLASHAFVLAGYLIVLALTRPALGPVDPPGSGGRAVPWWQVRFDDNDTAAPAPLARPPGSGVRDVQAGSAGRREAA